MSTRRSSALISTSKSSTTGSTATVTVEVWMRPLDSVIGTRCTRCTPDSYFSREYAPAPLTSKITSLKPPIPVSLLVKRPIFQRWFSAKRLYMRYKSAAKSAASSPPVPARISTMVSRLSSGSFGTRRSIMLSYKAAASSCSDSISSCTRASISGSDSPSTMVCAPASCCFTS